MLSFLFMYAYFILCILGISDFTIIVNKKDSAVSWEFKILNWSHFCWKNALYVNKLISFQGLMFIQGLLKIWTGHSNWFLLNPKLFEIASQKFQHCYNLERNEFSPNLKSVAQNLALPAHLKFSTFLAGNPNPRYLEPSNFVQSWFL